MRNSRIRPDVNAGSVADIAFLLLIFFLVCTTINVEEGIARDLPKPCADGAPCNVFIAQNNLLTIALGENNQLLVNDMVEDISNLKFILLDFIDNNASDTCDYCLGAGLPLASDHPQKAMISIETMRNASYDSYVAVQDEITAAYFELRVRYAVQQFDKPLNELNPQELKEVKEAYPFQIMESSL
ncbi:ExbD/TolR family protein [Gilvibacter sediminis]|uniref:ExbD/TolR family protein n=1 Tax=Gilvibacter sediminis TaxID=379071 RepID=UPI002350DB6A|nr:biopolymer transporter ExbD [Gilvibacter sediminis]MDC7998325.1 biopolymer transporter ExbD [Gilvibacter sediminis]